VKGVYKMRYFLIVGYKSGSYADPKDPVILGMIKSELFPSSTEQEALKKYNTFNHVHVLEVSENCHIEL
jgi:hypothetical protein